MKKWKITGCAIFILLCVLAALYLKGVLTADSARWHEGNKKGEWKTYTAFMAVQGSRISEDNRIMRKIAEKTGAMADIAWLSGQTAEEYIQTMIRKGEYPDFIDGSSATNLLLEAGVYIPLEDYLDDYPNLKGLFTQQQWNRLRQSDGHIYYIPQFSVEREKITKVQTSDEAFWIQKRVLEWAGYPTVKTLDEYFDLINSYLEANPDADDGETIGFEILCDDWRYFCLENVPMFLAGYPNDGCAIVNPETGEAHVYDTIPEAKQYYQKLSEEYDRGVIDPECFTLSFEQYLNKIASGNVLGMVDQYWQFMGAQTAMQEEGMEERSYVPLGITANEDIEGQYLSPVGLNTGNGLGITVDCDDVEGALQFLDDLLSEEIMVLRYWGEEGIDYEIDENGVFYRTQEQRKRAVDTEWSSKNLCSYSYLPGYGGMLPDGINTVEPSEQPGEYYAILSESDRRILDAYGYEKWTDFLNAAEENSDWYPLYTARNIWPEDTDYGQAKNEMDQVKKEWLPKLIMSPAEEYENLWQEYMEDYEQRVDVEAYEKELTQEVARRIALAKNDGSQENP